MPPSSGIATSTALPYTSDTIGVKGVAVTNLEAALDYRQRGWSVVPAFEMDGPLCACTRIDCPSPGKHPRIAWAQFQRERANEAMVRQWWRRWPTANIAIATGAVSNLVVLDIDPRHGGTEAVKDLGALQIGRASCRERV